MHLGRVRFFIGGLIILVLSGTSARAQATAQLNGTVRDQSGAALPGVTVTVTQTDTGLVRSVVTDDTGSYVLQNLPVGGRELCEGGNGLAHNRAAVDVDMPAGVMGIQRVQDVTLIRHAYVRTNSQKRGIGGRLLSHLRELTDLPVLIA